MMKRILATSILACLIVGCGQSSQTEGGGQTPTSHTTANTVTQTSITGKYPASAAGLKLLMTDILTATQSGDKEKAATLVKSLVLTNHEAWFKQMFGEKSGGKLSENYAQHLGNFEPQTSQFFAQMVKKGQTNVQVARFVKPGDPKALGLQNRALKAMRDPTALYSVRFVEPGKALGVHFWSFVYVDGAFRFVSKMDGI